MTTTDDSGLRTETITDSNGLARLGDEWRALERACPTATVFQTHAWNAAWWEHFGRRPGRRLHVAAVRDASGLLVGIAPLMTSFWHGTPLRRISFLGVGSSDYLDALAAPTFEDAVPAALYAHLHRWPGWQIGDFAQMRVGGLLADRPPSAGHGLAWQDFDGEACPFLPLDESWEAQAARLGKKTRTNIGYYTRSLGKVYAVEIGPVEDPLRLDPALDRLFELHQRRWNDRWLPGVFGGRRVRAFHRAAARALLAQGGLRLFTLSLDGEIEAALYCFAFGDRICYYQGGFEPTLAKFSLGTVLTAQAIQTAIAEGRTVFDFLRGDEPYKAKWTQEAHRNRRRVLARPLLGPLAFAAARQEEEIERRFKAWMRRPSKPRL